MESSKLHCKTSSPNCLGCHGNPRLPRQHQVLPAPWNRALRSRWWVLRHRLHHRFTDTDSDPYSANKGLFYSHVGWIFVKEEYPKLKLIDKRDLDNDPVVSFQHRYFIPLAVVGGLVLPAATGQVWFGSWIEGLVWGGIIARIGIWHCTYLPPIPRI
jgi:fatty-acid desaturase